MTEWEGRFYVYALLDSSQKYSKGNKDPNGLSHKPFYIGKGTNSRMHVHLKSEERYNTTHNPMLTEKLREMRIKGITVIAYKIKSFDKEEDAYKFEEELIRHYELSYKGGILTNGGYGKAGGWGNVQNPTYSRMKEGVHNFQVDNPAFTTEKLLILDKRLRELHDQKCLGGAPVESLERLRTLTGYGSERTVYIGVKRLIERKKYKLKVDLKNVY